MNESEWITRVLECANKAAGTNLTLNSEGDLPLEAFRFDSLSLFAFMVEVENTCGIAFDDVLVNQAHLRTIRTTAAYIAASREANRP
jgi:acyl carrier protein